MNERALRILVVDGRFCTIGLMFRKSKSPLVVSLPVSLLVLGVACTTSVAPDQRAPELRTGRAGLTAPGLYATGVDNAGVALAPGSADPHYTLVQSDDPAFVPPYAAPVMVDGYPIGSGVWVDNTASSKWISVQSGNSGTGGAGNFTFRTTFSLDEVDPTTAELALTWAADNAVSLKVNGTVMTFASPDYRATQSLTSTGPMGFVSGSNNLDFVVNNGGGPLGLLVQQLSVKANCTADTQCNAGRWCDGVFNAIPVCEDKLTNGLAVEGGTCSAALGARNCVSGACSTADNLCGLPNGDVATSVTECRTGARGADGKCGALNGESASSVAQCRTGVLHTDGKCGLPNGSGTCTGATAAAVCRSGLCSAGGTCVAAGACAVDVDCTGGWCKISTSTCNPKIPNERPVGADPSHTTPVLDGQCSAAAGALTCVSGVCDLTDDACGFPDGVGPCTAGDAAVVCRTGACRNTGVCGTNPVVVADGGVADGGSIADASVASDASVAADAGKPRDAATAAPADAAVVVGADASLLIGPDAAVSDSLDGSLEGGGVSCAANGPSVPSGMLFAGVGLLLASLTLRSVRRRVA